MIYCNESPYKCVIWLARNYWPTVYKVRGDRPGGSELHNTQRVNLCRNDFEYIHLEVKVDSCKNIIDV